MKQLMLMISLENFIMKARLSPFVQKELTTLGKRNSKLFLKVEKKIKQFEENPKHPSLRIHKLSGSMNNMWSLSVNKSFRLTYRLLDNDLAYFIDIGNHDEVYKK